MVSNPWLKQNRSTPHWTRRPHEDKADSPIAWTKPYSIFALSKFDIATTTFLHSDVTWTRVVASSLITSPSSVSSPHSLKRRMNSVKYLRMNEEQRHDWRHVVFGNDHQRVWRNNVAVWRNKALPPSNRTLPANLYFIEILRKTCFHPIRFYLSLQQCFLTWGKFTPGGKFHLPRG